MRDQNRRATATVEMTIMETAQAMTPGARVGTPSAVIIVRSEETTSVVDEYRRILS